MHTSGDQGRPQRRRLKKFVVPGLAVAAILGGGAMALYGARPRTYGWFAYAPLSETTFDSDPAMVVDPWSIAGTLCIVGGVLLLALVVVRRMGKRRLKAIAVPGLAMVAVLAGAVMVAYAAMPREFVTDEFVTLSDSPEFQDTMTGVYAWGIAGLALIVGGVLVLVFVAGTWFGRRR
ncbi:MAG: hypothetical protein WBX27_16580 [Specibacter sp.]